MDFGKYLIDWYQENKRPLPWRNTKNPYKIWISEIILQQTRVEQGLPYYLRFIKQFPTVKKLAQAKESEVLKLWQGLGYYTRARNMHAAANEIIKKHHGVFPTSYEVLLELKGIGAYTAAAIASFAYNKPHAVVDGNVFRVLSRYYGIETPVNSSEGQKKFFRLANQLLGKHTPSLFNQAIMEFGALQCKPFNPSCSSCILINNCVAANAGKVEAFPVKLKTEKVRTRYFNYLVIKNKSHVLLNQRTGKDIWKNLYDFPLIETKKKQSIQSIMKLREWKQQSRNFHWNEKLKPVTIIHQLSHQKIIATFFESNNEKVTAVNGYKKAGIKSVSRYALPRLIEKYFEITGK